MKDIKGREQKAYLVRDTKTGAVAVTYESYARKLEREGKKKIIAEEGTEAFEKGKIRG
jgi:hypothetical protein